MNEKRSLKGVAKYSKKLVDVMSSDRFLLLQRKLGYYNAIEQTGGGNADEINNIINDIGKIRTSLDQIQIDSIEALGTDVRDISNRFNELINQSIDVTRGINRLSRDTKEVVNSVEKKRTQINNEIDDQLKLLRQDLRESGNYPKEYTDFMIAYRDLQDKIKEKGIVSTDTINEVIVTANDFIKVASSLGRQDAEFIIKSINSNQETLGQYPRVEEKVAELIETIKASLQEPQ